MSLIRCSCGKPGRTSGLGDYLSDQAAIGGFGEGVVKMKMEPLAVGYMTSFCDDEGLHFVIAGG